MMAPNHNDTKFATLTPSLQTQPGSDTAVLKPTKQSPCQNCFADCSHCRELLISISYTIVECRYVTCCFFVSIYFCFPLIRRRACGVLSEKNLCLSNPKRPHKKLILEFSSSLTSQITLFDCFSFIKKFFTFTNSNL